MSGKTNRLIETRPRSPQSPRKIDVVISAHREQVIGLLCMALDDLGVRHAATLARR